MRPVDEAVHPPMFNGVVVDVIHMPVEIILIDYQMRPEPPLPYAAFAAIAAALQHGFPLVDGAGKMPLQQIPAGRKICIPCR